MLNKRKAQNGKTKWPLYGNLARHSARTKEKAKEKIGRKYQEVDRPRLQEEPAEDRHRWWKIVVNFSSL